MLELSSLVWFGVAVGVCVFVAEGGADGVLVGFGVVFVGFGVAVALGTEVEVGVTVGETVDVGVGVAVADCVGVGVAVGAVVGPDAAVTVNAGLGE